METVHRRVGGEESCAGVLIRADLWVISEVILRCRTGGVWEKWLKTSAFSSVSES